jgi:hypothetical protein
MGGGFAPFLHYTHYKILRAGVSRGLIKFRVLGRFAMPTGVANAERGGAQGGVPDPDFSVNP